MYSYLYAYIYGIFFMAELDTVEIAKQLFNNLIELIRGGNSGVDSVKPKETAADNEPSALSARMKSAIEGIGNMGIAAGEAAIGLRNVKNAAKTWEDTVDLMSKAAGTKLGEVIKYIDYNRQLAVDAAKVGMGQGQGVRGEGRVQDAGYDNFKDAITAYGKAGNTFRTFGNSAEDANNKFAKFGQKLQDDDLTGKLKNLGLVTAREIADVAMLAAGGKQDMLDSKEGRQRLAEQTVVYAQEIERQVKATSRSRESIMAEMLARQGSADQIQQDRLYRSDAERSAADSTRIATLGMGKSMQDITSTIMSGGFLNKTQRTELQVATGGRSGQYMAAVRDNRRTANMADNDPQKIAAKEKLDREIALMNAYQTSSRFNRQAQTTQDPDRKAAFDRVTVNNTEADRQRTIMKNTGKDAYEARKELLENRGDVALENRTAEGSKQPLGAPGTINEGARTAQTLQGAVESFRKNTAAMTTSLGTLNISFARSVDLMQKIEKGVTGAGTMPLTMTSDEAKVNARKNIDLMTSPFGFNNGPAAEKNAKAANSDGMKNLREKETRAHGTLGETGFPTEPKDIVARLHKGETVATPEQLKNLMSGSASNAISELMKSATSKTTPTAPTGNIDISKITSGLKEITTTISSVSGGASTTRSTVENDDAKAAKKELEAIKAQFQTEKNDIRSQVKSNLGPDAKGMDVIRAMRDNPQAKALEARIQEATAKLSTRISAGTSIDTKVEPGINRTSIKDMISENSSESAFNKLASIKDNTETEEPEEIAQPKEEIKFEEQSNKVGLEDLNEQLIQLNTSIRQLIQHSAESVETAGRQIKATKSLSGNRFA